MMDDNDKSPRDGTEDEYYRGAQRTSLQYAGSTGTKCCWQSTGDWAANVVFLSRCLPLALPEWRLRPP